MPKKCHPAEVRLPTELESTRSEAKNTLAAAMRSEATSSLRWTPSAPATLRRSAQSSPELLSQGPSTHGLAEQSRAGALGGGAGGDGAVAAALASSASRCMARSRSGALVTAAATVVAILLCYDNNKASDLLGLVV